MTRPYAVRGSEIHGRGLFARETLGVGTDLGEFTGRRTTWESVPTREDAEEGHTFLFDLGDGTVLDGGSGGNSLRWMNHGCVPNCEAVQDGPRIWFQTSRPVVRGDELLIDYALQVDVGETREDYPCRCGSTACRGSMVEADPA